MIMKQSIFTEIILKKRHHPIHTYFMIYTQCITEFHPIISVMNFAYLFIKFRIFFFNAFSVNLSDVHHRLNAFNSSSNCNKLLSIFSYEALLQNNLHLDDTLIKNNQFANYSPSLDKVATAR